MLWGSKGSGCNCTFVSTNTVYPATLEATVTFTSIYMEEKQLGLHEQKLLEKGNIGFSLFVFIKSWSFDTDLFSILCDERDNIHKEFRLSSEGRQEFDWLHQLALSPRSALSLPKKNSMAIMRHTWVCGRYFLGNTYIHMCVCVCI